LEILKAMKKITELYIEKEYLKSDKDAFGNKIRVPYTAKVKREVETISGWARFGHYLLDLIIIYVINFVLGIFIGLLAPHLLEINDIFWNIISMLLTVMYYFAFESTIQTTIGKLATNSVVVDEYGNKPSNSQLIGRSFARIIPFEAFSCLGYRGWHDTLSKTYVVSRAELATLKRMMSEQDGEFFVDSREDILD
jgi:uncharacterized RDD family membrane protein YckC